MYLGCLTRLHIHPFSIFFFFFSVQYISIPIQCDHWLTKNYVKVWRMLWQQCIRISCIYLINSVNITWYDVILYHNSFNLSDFCANNNTLTNSVSVSSLPSSSVFIPIICTNEGHARRIFEFRLMMFSSQIPSKDR